MDHFDLLDVVEMQTEAMTDSISALRLVSDDLERVIREWMKNPFNYPLDWILTYCGAFAVMIRDLEHIHGDLDSAVDREYENRRAQNGYS